MQMLRCGTQVFVDCGPFAKSGERKSDLDRLANGWNETVQPIVNSQRGEVAPEQLVIINPEMAGFSATAK